MPEIDFFICPTCHSTLKFSNSGNLICEKKHEFENHKNSHYFNLLPNNYLHINDQNVMNFYDDRAQAYDDNLHLTFYTHNLDEDQERKKFISNLSIKPNSRILEIACGTGRDSIIIGNMLNSDGELHLTDISKNMLDICYEKLQSRKIKATLSLSDCHQLPYPDSFFDSVYSFGAIGELSNISAALKEIVRVTKDNGRVVIGDESISPWLKNSNFYKILSTTNPQFEVSVPLENIPFEARNLKLEWVINNCFYLISFDVDKNEPKANFDFKIPGIRGGTYRTRFEGKLEGVSPEAKEHIMQLAIKNKTSVHDLLNKIILDTKK
jgi:ubiquinone/menaquinone biosynthesis C-methylase UbiE